MTKTSSPNVSINIESASARWFQILATLLLCFGIGAFAYAVAQRGWIEIAATMVTTFLFQFVRLLVMNGLMVFPKRGGGSAEPESFSETRGLLKTAYAEYVEWQAKSPIWRLAALSIAYTIVFMIFRWLTGVSLQVFSNMWVAGGATAILAAAIISPTLFRDLFGPLSSRTASKKDKSSAPASAPAPGAQRISYDADSGEVDSGIYRTTASADDGAEQGGERM